MRAIFHITMVIFAAFLSGCFPDLTQEVPKSLLTFRAPMSISADGILRIDLEVQNEGEEAFIGSDAFDAVMEIFNKRTTERTLINISTIGKVAAQDCEVSASWQASLPPDEYTLIWGAPGYGYSRVDFSICEKGGCIHIGEQYVTLSKADPPILLDYDSTATGLFSTKAFVINSVNIRPAESIAFGGFCTLPKGSCLLTQLFENNEPVSWWPSGTCADCASGIWQIGVSLGEDGIPSELNSDSQYFLKVWNNSDPSHEAIFCFDVIGPPIRGQ